MSRSDVVAVSLVVGFAIGITLLMVLWGCKACLGKPSTKDDDRNEAQLAPATLAAPAPDGRTPEHVSVAVPPVQIRPSKEAPVCYILLLLVRVTAESGSSGCEAALLRGALFALFATPQEPRSCQTHSMLKYGHLYPDDVYLSDSGHDRGCCTHA